MRSRTARFPVRRISSRALAAAAALVASFAASPGARADDELTFPECPRRPTPSEVEGAKGAHQAASRFYDRAEYERAIQYWRDAYQFDCTAHAVLINIANAYEKLGKRRAAVVALETYLAREPNAPGKETIAEKIKNLKESLERSPEPAPAPTPVPQPEPAPAASAAPLPPTAPPPAGSSAGAASSSKSIAPWIVMGAGGATAIAGAILLPVGLGAISSAEKICPVRTACASQEAIDQGNGGRVQSAVGGILLGVGGAAIATGLVWQLAFGSGGSAKSAGLLVAPMASATTGGLALGGTF